MQDSKVDGFRRYVWRELLHEWPRFLIIEAATLFLAAVGSVLSTSGHRPEWMPAWDLAASFLGALVIGVVLHVCCAFGFAWVRFMEDRLGSFEKALTGLKEEIAGNFLTVAEHLRVPTGLSNDALATLSKYLSDADKLYSVVYVRPSLWLRLGDLMNVFSLQAFYHHRRLDLGRPLEMVRFLIWNREQFVSPAGIFIIRASILIGAKTKIITKGNIKEVIRKYGTTPALHRLVDGNLHVWLDCKICDGEEKPQSGRYGEVTDKGFAEPHSMRKQSDAVESEHNFFELISLLDEFSVELDPPSGPDDIQEANLKDHIVQALGKLHSERRQPVA